MAAGVTSGDLSRRLFHGHITITATIITDAGKTTGCGPRCIITVFIGNISNKALDPMT